MTMNLAKAPLLFTMMSVAVWPQVNVGEQRPETSLPFTMTTVATFNLPWRLAFLPDGRMLVTEKVGPVWTVSQQGEKILVGNTPPVYWSGQSGFHGELQIDSQTGEVFQLTYEADLIPKDLGVNHGPHGGRVRLRCCRRPGVSSAGALRNGNAQHTPVRTE
jgi:hypothetical protein